MATPVVCSCLCHENLAVTRESTQAQGFWLACAAVLYHSGATTTELPPAVCCACLIHNFARALRPCLWVTHAQ